LVTKAQADFRKGAIDHLLLFSEEEIGIETLIEEV
jgi:hypothetical protein